LRKGFKKLIIRSIVSATLMTWAILISPAFINADGDSRPATKQEKDFYRQVKTTFSKAIPASGPAGWEEVERSVIEELKRVGIAEGADEEQPFVVDYYVAWRDSKRKEAADEKAQQALNAQVQQQQSQPDNAEYSKLEKLADELGKAAEAGDMDKVSQLQAEMEKIAAKMNQIQSGNDTEQNQLQEKMAPHDVDARISICANYLYEDFYSPVKQQTSIAGGLVYRTEGKYTRERGWREGYTYVFLGKNWRSKRDGDSVSMEAAPIKGLSNLTVQTITIKIQAAPARAKELINKINWELLKKLIKN
jgi:hypothetical protein